jgi:hypothetical protein
LRIHKDGSLSLNALFIKIITISKAISSIVTITNPNLHNTPHHQLNLHNMHLSITLTLLLSLLCISLAAPTPKPKPTPAREVATSDKHQVSWGLLANGPAFTGIPVILGAAGSVSYFLLPIPQFN